MEQRELATTFSSLARSDRQRVFKEVMTRVEQVASISSVLHIKPSFVDRWLPGVVEWMEQRLEPCGLEVAGEAVNLAVRLLRCRPPTDEQLAGYVSLLSRYPRDLLFPSIAAAIAKETHHVLPTPGALLAQANEKLKERRDKLLRAKLHRQRVDFAAQWQARVGYRHYA